MTTASPHAAGNAMIATVRDRLSLTSRRAAR
jgi:hypothetical protein